MKVTVHDSLAADYIQTLKSRIFFLQIYYDEPSTEIGFRVLMEILER